MRSKVFFFLAHWWSLLDMYIDRDPGAAYPGPLSVRVCPLRCMLDHYYA